MPFDLKKYPKNWREIARSIKDKAGWKCEFCGVDHGAIRTSITSGKPYKVILTVAHCGENKQDKMDVTDLKALCQLCHLRLDINEHVSNARETRRKKKLAIQPMLEGLEG